MLYYILVYVSFATYIWNRLFGKVIELFSLLMKITYPFYTKMAGFKTIPNFEASSYGLLDMQE